MLPDVPTNEPVEAGQPDAKKRKLGDEKPEWNVRKEDTFSDK